MNGYCLQSQLIITNKMTVSSSLAALLFVEAIAVFLIQLSFGEVILIVSPYPARIYQGAPENVYVLKVQAYDNNTGAAVSNFILNTEQDATYFKVDSTGVITTRKPIQFTVGHECQFFVAGFINNQHDYKHVKVIVSVKNQYPPQFSEPYYSFAAYRYGVGDDIGALPVTDKDKEEYNRAINVVIGPGQIASGYFAIDKDQHLRMIRYVPDNIQTLNFTVIATDQGSPQLSSTVNVEVEIVKIRQPSTFCLLSTMTTITVCWKNPMPGQFFNGYNFTISGGTNRSIYLPAIGDHTEACFTENSTGLGYQYIIKVTVSTTGPSSHEDLDIIFNKTKTGHSRHCESEGFSVCSYMNPCNDHGRCTTSTATNYTCSCELGWQGRNCQIQDVCVNSPCSNNGVCEFKGHKEYKCHCAAGYYGVDCEFPDQCLDIPCQNDGLCVVLNNGSYRCECLSHFTGDKCQVSDPCLPSPCVANRGVCLRVSDTEYNCSCSTGFSGPTCEHENACQLAKVNPCYYNSTCVPAGDSYTCVCPPGTTGKRCEYFDPCYLQLCLNNGTCTSGHIPGTYKCNCVPGFSGDECQYNDFCHGINCNNGTCVRSGSQIGKCQCNKGFHGELCDKFDVCLTSPCKNNGLCNSSGPSLNYQTSFTCSCMDNWTGTDCSVANKCSVNICKNGGTCLDTQSQGIRCICPDGFYMNDCSAFDPCFGHSCLNGAVCKIVSEDKYVCECQEDWMGDFCAYQNPCSVKMNPCQSGGICRIVGPNPSSPPSSKSSISSFTSLSFLSKCDCTDDFFGETCQYRNPCRPSPCVHGDCQFNSSISILKQSNEYTCSCFKDYTGKHCDSIIYLCENISCINGGVCTGGLCACPAGFTGVTCEQTLPVCQNMDGNKRCFDDTAMRNLRGLQDSTSDPSKLNVEQVMNFTDQLVDLYNHTLLDPMYAWTAFCVVGNLAKVNLSVSEESERVGNVSKRLLGFLNNYTSEVKIEDSDGQINISTPELQVKVSSFKRMLEHGNSTISFQPYTVVNDTAVQMNLEIKMPLNVLNDINKSDEDTRIQFIGYKHSQLFVPADGFPDGETLEHTQPVISATIKGKEIRNLTDPVEIRLMNRTLDGNYTCVFWDPKVSKWSTEGVTMIRYDGDSVTCASTHLTSFAILLDVNVERTVSEEHERILTYLTYIGCAISTSCLVITIVTYAMFKCLNNEKSGKILLQLCAALLLLNISFLAGTVDVSDYSNGGCLTVAMFLHFFLLCSLMWMLVEAVEMYQALVTVFSKYERLYLVKRCILAWGIPVLIVSITAAVDSESYYEAKEKRQFCFLTSKSTVAYYTSLVAPSCAIILVNTFVFIMVARVILKPNFQQQLTKNSTSITPAQIRGAFTVMFLLGITWVFGPLAINEAQTVFSYLFCICNSLQGFLVFVFRCLLNPEAKMAWLQLLRTGTFKRKRGPIKSVYTDSTSKGGDIRRPSTTNTSGFVGSSDSRASLNKNGNGFHPHPHQLHTTNGWHPSLNGLKRDKAQTEIKPPFNPSDYCIKENKKMEHVAPEKRDSMTEEAIKTGLLNEHTQF